MSGMEVRTCAEQESFVRGGPTLLFFVCLFKLVWWSIIAPPAKRHLNGLSVKWRFGDGPTFNAGLEAL